MAEEPEVPEGEVEKAPAFGELARRWEAEAFLRQLSHEVVMSENGGGSELPSYVYQLPIVRAHGGGVGQAPRVPVYFPYRLSEKGGQVQGKL